MSEHTPGPWTFVENIEGAIKLGVDDAWEVGNEALKIGVALVPGRKANAHLVAAAPDLLEAAQLLEAAELARGPNCEECGGEGEPEACGLCFPRFDDARIKRRIAIAKATAT